MGPCTPSRLQFDIENRARSAERNSYLPGRLGGTQISAKDIGVGMFICKLYGPYAGTGPKVEHSTLQLLVDGSEVELVAEADFQHLVCHVEAFEFALN